MKIETLYRKHRECVEQKKSKDAKLIMDKIYDFIQKNYSQCFSDKCVSCGEKILSIGHPKKVKEYEARGNYCIACSGRISRNAKKFYKENKLAMEQLIAS